jgi:hypothetical protein
MDDRELLKLAAKAAGLRIYSNSAFVGAGGGKPELFLDVRCGIKWNPLEDNGDAIQLAIQLGIREPLMRAQSAQESADARRDQYAATRRAIVLAAAEIGKQKGV